MAEMLGSEYCSGYFDLHQDHRWVEGFYCPQPESKSANLCCGSSSTYKFCCNHELVAGTGAVDWFGEDATAIRDDGSSDSIFEPAEIPVIVGLVLVVATLIAIVACVYCECCLLFFKKRLDELEAASMSHFLWHGVYDLQQAQAARDAEASEGHNWESPPAPVTSNCNGHAPSQPAADEPRPASTSPPALEMDPTLLKITDELNKLNLEPLHSPEEGRTSFGATIDEMELELDQPPIPLPVEELNCVNSVKEMLQYQKQIEDMFPLPLPQFEHFHEAKEPTRPPPPNPRVRFNLGNNTSAGKSNGGPQQAKGSHVPVPTPPPMPYLIPDSARPPIHPSTRRRPTTVHYPHSHTNGYGSGGYAGTAGAGGGRIDLSPRVSPYSTLPLPQSPKFVHKHYSNTVRRNGNVN